MKDNDLLFNVKIGEFDGPLDVLDNIIREHRLDILDLDIAKLAEQYLIFIQTNIKTVSIDVASEYLAMATYLLELKSKKIIPVDSDVSDNSNFEYQRNKLIKQIMEFKKYRDVVTVLIKKQNTRMQMLAKPADDLENYVTNKTIEAMPKSVDPNKLAHALQIAFEKWKFKLFTNRKIMVQELAVDDIEKDILNFLVDRDERISFSEYLSHVDEIKISQQYIVTCFVALLELVKYRQIDLVQEEAEIYFTKNKNAAEIENSLIQRGN